MKYNSERRLLQILQRATLLFLSSPQIVIIPAMSTLAVCLRGRACSPCARVCCSRPTGLAFGGRRRLSRRPAAFHCQPVTDCGEGALASCLDMDVENAERGETTCGSGGMDGCRRAWPLDIEPDSCYRGVGVKEGGAVCRTGGGPHCPFIYFDLGAAGGPGRAHAKLPRRAEPPQPPSHLSARPSVSSQIYVCLWPGCSGGGGGDTALF